MADGEWAEEAADWVIKKWNDETTRQENENNKLKAIREQIPQLFSELTKWLSRQMELFNERAGGNILERSYEGGFSIIFKDGDSQRQLLLKRSADAILCEFLKDGQGGGSYRLPVGLTKERQLVFSTPEGVHQSTSDAGSALLNELIGRK